jgi:tyrosine-protein kinase Etk/Wzc
MNKPLPRQQAGNSADFQKYFLLIRRNWYWFIIALIVSLIIAKLYNVLAPRSYKVSCEIVIGEKDMSSEAMPQQVDEIDFNNINPINKEIGVLKSKNLAEQTISQLDFNISYYELIKGSWIKRRRYNELPFQIKTDSNNYAPSKTNIYLKVLNNDEVKIHINGEYDIDRVLKIGEKFNVSPFSFRISLKKNFRDKISDYINSEYLFYFNNSSEIINEYWEKLQVEMSPMSQNILTLSITGENVLQGIVYLNKLCEIYDSTDLALRNRMASNTIIYIDGQLALLNEQLITAEDSLIRFKRQNRLFQQESNNALSDEFLKLEESLKDEQLNIQSIVNIKKKLDTIAAGSNIILPLLFTSDDSRLSAGITSINKMVIDREILLKNQKKQSPAVMRANQQIQVEVQAFQSYLDQEFVLVNKRIERIRAEMKKLEAQLLDLPAVERQLAKLTRDYELTDNLYNLYQQKRIEAKLAEAATVSNMRVLAPPTKESAILVSPKKKNNFQIAAIFGLLIPFVFLFITEIFTNRVRDIHDINGGIDLPVLGKIAHSKANSYLPSSEFPWAAITESFRTLHAKLKYMLTEPDMNVIAITSGSSGEGKTFCAMNLATVIAGAGKKVLLLELDLRRPKIHEVFRIDNREGLTTYLIGTSKKETIIRNTHIPNLYILNAGPIPPNPTELIEHERMEKLIEKCRKEYDFVILDSPPIGLVADALLLNRLVDIYLFVIRIDHSRKNVSGLLKELNEAASLKKLSLIFNDIRQPERYGYGYYNSYYQREEQRKWGNRFFKTVRRLKK